jgi:5-methyltetrahydropteroyltriglutamate--homocysteine methyltransferase
MKHSEHRILTTHVGSLVRPKELRDLAPAGQEPKDLAQYNTVLHQQTLEVVRKQAEIGIDIVSDGEYGKQSWSNYVLKRISGFEIRITQPSIEPSSIS